MDDILKAYINIFHLDPKQLRLNRVKFIGKSKPPRGDSIYNFIGIITAPAPYENLIVSTNDMVKARNYVSNNLKGLVGVDVVQKVAWKVKIKGKDKKKRKSFDFAYQLEPQSVLEFEIVNGMYYIKANVYGLFYN
jgi:hypothetical protein